MTDNDEWKGTKAQRAQLRQKFNGRCGYCGDPLTNMHADHLDPVIRITVDPWGRPLPVEERRMVNPGRNVVGNMMPACAACNISKGGYKLEEWRDLIARAHEIVAKQKSIFKTAVRLGAITVNDQPVVFFFERPEAAE